ncbi:MAG: hypothetical protein GY797_38755 [Deltaproteobacteria bacterium]|nr:hypothetical protein [Deltaproteobacteria bacterium]
MFEIASRRKLRFPTRKGNLTAEDLWDLPLTSKNGASLDNLAKSLNKEIKETDEESFVEAKSTVSKDLETKFAIVKRVIVVRLEQVEKRKNAKVAKEKREQILRLIADKENDQLASKSLEELKALL